MLHSSIQCLQDSGESNPKVNPRLAKLIEEVRSHDFEVAFIQASIKKATDKSIETGKEFAVAFRGSSGLAGVVEALATSKAAVISQAGYVMKKNLCVFVSRSIDRSIESMT